MDHSIVHIEANPKQLSKLRNGRAVRVKPVAEGMGMPLVVHPHRIGSFMKSMKRGKGTEITLTPEEMNMNKIHGKGIFGRKFDDGLKKLGIKKLAYALGDQLKPHAKTAIIAGTTALGTALAGSSAVGSLGLGAAASPAIIAASYGLGNTLADYVDNPKKYQQRRWTESSTNKHIERSIGTKSILQTTK